MDLPSPRGRGDYQSKLSLRNKQHRTATDQEISHSWCRCHMAQANLRYAVLVAAHITQIT